MVLRFLILLAFFIFSCSSHDRDNANDRDTKNFKYETCGEWNYNPYPNDPKMKERRCNEKYIIESKCGIGGWYDTTNSTLRCQNNVIETRCGNSWYNASNFTLRCQNNVIETRCGDSWYDASKSNFQCKDSIIETTCGSNWYDIYDINLRCRNDVVETKCGIGWYDTTKSTLRCKNDVVETKCGSSWYNASNSTLRCQNNNVVEKRCGNDWYDTSMENNTWKCQNNVLYKFCYDVWYNVTTDYCSTYGEVAKYGKLVDNRDRKTYKTVIVDNQTWMAENLNYYIYSTNSKCYDNDETNCNIYGRLYNWNEAQTVCPNGWHLPEDDEWSDLTYNIYTDDYGFAPLLGGRSIGDSFYEKDSIGFWWSATPGATTSTAFSQKISFEKENNSFSSSFLSLSKSYLLSVRCVMNSY